MTRRVVAALLTVLGIVCLVGCASSAAAPASTTRSASAPSQQPTTSPVAVVSAPATATPIAHAARCLPGALAVELLVVNTGAAPCLVEGYPRVRLRGMADLVVRYVDGQSQYMSSQPPRPVVLAPKAAGYLLVAGNVVSVSPVVATERGLGP